MVRYEQHCQKAMMDMWSSKGRIFGGDSLDANLANVNICDAQVLNGRGRGEVLGGSKNVLGPRNSKSNIMEGLKRRSLGIENRVGVTGFDWDELTDLLKTNSNSVSGGDAYSAELSSGEERKKIGHGERGDNKRKIGGKKRII